MRKKKYKPEKHISDGSISKGRQFPEGKNYTPPHQLSTEVRETGRQ